jgi:predicted alpha/beta hydrolase family esterase
MNKRKTIFFAHSAGRQDGPGQGSYDLVQSLRKELTDQFDILYPIIKNPEAPSYQNWSAMLAEEFSKLQSPIILVGHSLGGSVLLKYLAENPVNIDVSGLFLVATPHWGSNVGEFMLPEDFKKKLSHLSPIYLYHGIGDTEVPFRHLDFYRNAFKRAWVRELATDDHIFSNGLPELIVDIKRLT